MSESIEFITNYKDLSTENGFQYEFRCSRCGSGFRTRFKSWGIATVSNIAEAVGDFFGGVFGKAAHLGEHVRSAAWEKAHDEAYEDAVKEIKPQFIQCPRCNEWVCREGCWNRKKGLCKGCAPDLGVEMSAAQSSRSVEEIWAHSAMAEGDKKLAVEYWRETILGTCPQCEEPLHSNARFCPNCGAKLKQKLKCPKCKAILTPGDKFCPECGVEV